MRDLGEKGVAALFERATGISGLVPMEARG